MRQHLAVWLIAFAGSLCCAWSVLDIIEGGAGSRLARGNELSGLGGGSGTRKGNITMVADPSICQKMIPNCGGHCCMCQ